MEEFTQFGILFMRAMYCLIGAGFIYTGTMLIVGWGTVTPDPPEKKVPMKRIPAKGRAPYGVYFIVVGLITVSSVFVSAVWPWAAMALLPFILFMIFVIFPSLKRQATALEAPGDTGP